MLNETKVILLVENKVWARLWGVQLPTGAIWFCWCASGARGAQSTRTSSTPTPYFYWNKPAGVGRVGRTERVSQSGGRISTLNALAATALHSLTRVRVRVASHLSPRSRSDWQQQLPAAAALRRIGNVCARPNRKQPRPSVRMQKPQTHRDYSSAERKIIFCL